MSRDIMHATCWSATLLLIAMSCAVLSGASAARAGDDDEDERPKAFEVQAGFDVAPQATYSYSEVVAALNRNVEKNGFLFRINGSVAAYKFQNLDITPGDVDGRLWQLDVMGGYQVIYEGIVVRGFVGWDYQNADLTPDDPTSKINGERTGVKVAGRFDYDQEKVPFSASLSAEYSTAYDTYYAELRVGLKLWDKLVFGPQGSVDGDTGYNAQRLGGFVTYLWDVTSELPLGITLAAGHQFVNSGTSGGSDDGITPGGFGGGAGTYGMVSVDTAF